MKFFVENLKRNFEFLICSKLEAQGASKEAAEKPKNPEGPKTPSNLDPKAKKVFEKTKDKLVEKKKKVEGLKGESKYKGGIASNLETSLKQDSETLKDPEAQPTIQMCKQFKKQAEQARKDGIITEKEVQKLQQQLESIKQGGCLEQNDKIDITAESKELTQAEKHIDFLEKSESERLEALTNMDISKINSGEVDSIEVALNNYKDLDKVITSGQLLPKNIGSVKVGTEEYKRDSLKGEFYSTKTGEPLIISEGMKLTDMKLRGKDDLDGFNEKTKKLYDSIIESRPSLEKKPEKLKILLDKGLSEKELTMVSDENMESMSSEELEIIAGTIGKEKAILNTLSEKGKLPTNLQELQAVLNISKYLQNELGEDSSLSSLEKQRLSQETTGMSVNQVAKYIEKNEHNYGSTGVDYKNVGPVYTGKIKTNPEGMTGRMKIKDIIPNTSLDLNTKYDKYTIDKVPEKRKNDVMNILKTFPEPNEEWSKIVCRNAINNPNFTDKKPFIAQNLSYKTAVIYYPGEDKATVIPAVHGVGIGGIGEVSNVNGSHGSSLGSKELVAQGGGKYKFRVVVKGLEPVKKNVKISRGEAMNMDPSEIGNQNDQTRLIRIHEKNPGKGGTWGCSGLMPGDAKKLYDSIKLHGGGSQEIFVSKV